MIVVADTSPLRYLVVIEHERLLPALFGSVLVPPAVAHELNQESTPQMVRAWLAKRPHWLEIQQPSRSLSEDVDLDEGEREAIALAEEVAADLLLMDDRDGRREAERRNLRVVGTIRVLADGAREDITDLEQAFERLRETNFRVNSRLLDALLEEHRRGRHP